MGTLKGGLNVAWAWGAAFDLMERAITSTWSHIPIFTHAVTVAVSGGPAADLRRVWYLACAIAFGRMRKSPALRGGSATMQATWDVTAKSAQIELNYQIAKTQYSEDVARPFRRGRPIAQEFADTLGEIIAGVPVAARDRPRMLSPKDSPLAMIQLGPDQITVGGGWPEFLRRHDQVNAVRPRPAGRAFNEAGAIDPNYSVTPLTRVNRSGAGVGNLFREYPTTDATGQASFIPFQMVQPTAANDPALAGSTVDRRNVVTLPDDGRLITTGEKSHPTVQSPRPSIDGATRSSLLSLIANELSDPCYLPPLAPLGRIPLYSTGYQLYPAGAERDYASVSSAVQSAAGTASQADAGPDAIGIRLPATRPDFR